MSRSLNRVVSAGFIAAVALTTTPGVAPASADSTNPAVLTFTAEVLDFSTTVESIDGAQTDVDASTSRTVVLTSDVLFGVDSAVLNPKAKAKLTQLAAEIVASATKGPVTVDGFTDDQGSAAHGLVLSRQRAEAVQAVLAPLVPGITIATRGFGEAKPRVPNIVKGKPSAANRAKNRRVEIAYPK